MKRMLVMAVVAGLAGCQSARPAGSGAGGIMQPAPAPASAAFVPAGTVLHTRINHQLSTHDSRVGDAFTLTVQESLVALNGETVIPAGSTITGVVTGVGGAGEQAAIRLNFTRIEINGVSHPFVADIVETRRLDERRDAGDVARGAAAGAAAGAVLGAVISGGRLRDVLVGGALGAGAGTIISLGLGGVDQVLPEGTHMTLQTTQRINLR